MNTTHVVIMALLLAVLTGCKGNGPVGMQSDAERVATLRSLKKINDYPLYMMTYYGDYGFTRYLHNPSTPIPSTSAQAHETFFCTCFATRGADSSQWFGRNFDWHTYAHTALLVSTHAPGAYASVSMVFLWGLGYTSGYPLDAPQNEAALLASPYWPVDGMNECGVSIACMSVDRVSPPWSANKKTLNRMAIIRLVLDYAKDTDEAIRLLNQYNFDFDNDPLHYLICDATGHSAIVEFIDNELKVIRNTLNWQVSTNSIVYGAHMPEAADFAYTSGNQSLWRYGRANEMLHACGGTVTGNTALAILNAVSADTGPPTSVNTMWSIAYNLRTREMDIVMDRKYSEVCHLSLSGAY